jgi:antibiotic biosynthesis monooxygenase (ABM) superfamily enzyme
MMKSTILEESLSLNKTLNTFMISVISNQLIKPLYNLLELDMKILLTTEITPLLWHYLDKPLSPML